MSARHSIAGGWFPREIVLLLGVLATLPLWIGPIGLYQYLGVCRIRNSAKVRDNDSLL